MTADGVPVSRARVTIVEATVPIPEIALITDPDGQFELALPEGRFRLRAHGPRGEVGEAEIECDAAPGDLVICLRGNAESTRR